MGISQAVGGQQRFSIGGRNRNDQLPQVGDRIEISRTGTRRCGTVHYADQLQVLVKWDDGSSSSLRIERDEFRIVEHHTDGRAPAA